MTRSDRLADAVAAAGPTLLRSSVPTAAAPTARGPLRLEAALDLGEGRSVCVVADQAGARWTVPTLERGGKVRRAGAGDRVAEALVNRLVGGALVEPPFAIESFAGHSVGQERAVGVDQTN
jgi:hypothetical protein